MPATESEYRRGIRALENYLEALKRQDGSAQFYARADNLNYWLNEVQNRLGSLSLSLSQSVGRTQLNTDNDTPVGELDKEERFVKTGWMEIDNVFYEARGASWALVQLMRAVEVDFADVLRRKNATVSFRQMVRELEATPADPVEPGDSERLRFRSVRQPLAGDGQLHHPRQRLPGGPAEASAGGVNRDRSTALQRDLRPARDGRAGPSNGKSFSPGWPVRRPLCLHP